MFVVELFKKKSLVIITAIIFVGIAHAHEYDEHQTIRRLARKKEVARRRIDRIDTDKEDVEFWTRLMKVGSMPNGGVSHTLIGTVILYKKVMYSSRIKISFIN